MPEVTSNAAKKLANSPRGEVHCAHSRRGHKNSVLMWSCLDSLHCRLLAWPRVSQKAQYFRRRKMTPSPGKQTLTSPSSNKTASLPSSKQHLTEMQELHSGEFCTDSIGNSSGSVEGLSALAAHQRSHPLPSKSQPERKNRGPRLKPGGLRPRHPRRAGRRGGQHRATRDEGHKCTSPSANTRSQAGTAAAATEAPTKRT
jgi:hypothetical protein